MEIFKIIAKFIGANGSCGYKTNQVYKLIVEIHKDNSVSIYHRGHQECIYSTFSTLCDNWVNINKIQSK
jgi:hypothetical protein